jgi:Zn-finger nucleic acid-binding protein
VVIERCGSCKGCFVDHAAMHRLVAARAAWGAVRRTGHAPPRNDEDRRLKCPECGKVMRLCPFAHGSAVIIDVCDDHGTWFDALELDIALEAVQPGTRWARTESPPARSDEKPTFPRLPARRDPSGLPIPFVAIEHLARDLASAARRRDRDDVLEVLAKLEALTKGGPPEE